MIEIKNDNGFTMIELVIVIVISGILAGVAMQKYGDLADNSRFETTRAELDMLSMAITGNPDLHNNGVRSDFGYIGDVGAFPPNLDALTTNPGGFSTWNGPYVDNSFEQFTDDFKKDEWNVSYTYSGGLIIQSTGGSQNIVRQLATTVNDLLYNSVAGNIFDSDGTPPGTIYRDSIDIILTFPDGAGSTTAKSVSIDEGGFFSVDSIPIGAHNMQIVYTPNNDTLNGYLIIEPSADSYELFRLSDNYWF